MKLNEYLVKNPATVEGIFTKLFGKYMMRYYDKTEDYSVKFSTTDETSYNNSKDKVISIALKNVNMLLKNDVPVLAIAYHELAHTLYTSQRKKENIIHGVFYDRRASCNFDKIHSIWNILEDERIERKLVKDYKFLADIIEPLRTQVTDDGLLMNWRCGKKDKAPQELMDLAEEFARKNMSTADSIEVISKIITTYYPDSQNTQAPQPYQEKQIDFSQQDEDEEQTMPGCEDEENDINEDGYYDLEEDFADDEETEETDGEFEDDEDDENDEDIEEEQPKTEEEKMLERMAQEQKNKKFSIDDLDAENQEVIIDIMKDFEKSINEMRDRQEYNECVVSTKGPANKENYAPKIEMNFSSKQAVRKGMTQAQGKNYSSNISNRLSVERVIESKARKSEPKVFYGKGKDTSFMKKVVVFEDISGSTQGPLTSLFSSLALSIVKSFENSDWWGYANRLSKKHVEDYLYETMEISRGKKLGGGTSTENLLTVMKQYNSKDNVYVLITDGDMGAMFKEENKELFEKYKNNIAIVGILDEDIKKRFPFHADMIDIFQQKIDRSVTNAWEVASALQGWRSNPTSMTSRRKIKETLIIDSMHKVIDMINNRIK